MTLVVARFQYQLLAIGGFLTVNDIGRINVVFIMAFKWGLTTNVPIASDLMIKLIRSYSKQCLMSNTASIRYCLQYLTSLTTAFEREAITFTLLPLVRTNLHKESFIVRCLFKYALEQYIYIYMSYIMID